MTSESVFFICIFILIVLFAGSPDLMDALVKFIMTYNN